LQIAAAGLARDQLLAIFRGWQRACRRAHLSNWLRSPESSGVAFGIASLSMVLLVFLDERLWSIRLFGAPWLFLAPASGALAAGVFALVWALNAWFCRAMLTQVAWEPWRYRRTARWLYCVCGGFPLFGPLVMLRWQRRPAQGKVWLLRAEGDAPGVSLAARAWRPPRRHGSSLEMLVMLVGGFLALEVTALWLIRHAKSGVETLSLSLPLRFAAFSAVWTFLGEERIRLHASDALRRGARMAALCWLLPIPYVEVASLLLAFTVDPATVRSDTLTWRILSRRKAAARLPIWLRLEDALRHDWQQLSLRERLWSPPPTLAAANATDAYRRIASLYDYQTLGLVLDTGGLAWILAWLGANQPALQPLSGLLLAIQRQVPPVLGSVALGVSALHFAVALLRIGGPLRQLDRQPYASYLAGGQLAIFAGYWLGTGVEAGHGREAGRLLMLLCNLAITTAALAFILEPAIRRAVSGGRRMRDLVPPVALLFGGMVLFGAGGPLGLLPFVLGAWTALAPLRTWFLQRTFLPWLLRPFAWRDVTSPDLPAGMRLRLLALATAVLPFGGLAVPLAIWLRHRRWPEATELAGRLRR
jgi:hypothetical protein